MDDWVWCNIPRQTKGVFFSAPGEYTLSVT